MLDFLDSQRPPAGALDALARLVADFGREHKWGYALSAVLLGLVAAFRDGVALGCSSPVVNGMAASSALATCGLMALEAFGLFVLRGAATYGSMVTLARIGNRIVASVQRRVFDHLLHQNMLFFQDRHSSEFVARLALAANGVRDALQFVIQGVARDGLMVVALVGVMLLRDPLLAVLALCVLPVAALFLGRVIRKRAHAFVLRGAPIDGSTEHHADDGRDRARHAHRQGVQSQKTRCASACPGTRSRGVERSANRIAAGGALATLMADSLAGLAIGFAIYYGSWRVSVASRRSSALSSPFLPPC